MKKKLKRNSPLGAAICSPSSTPEMDAAAYEATTRTVGKWIVPVKKAQKIECERNSAWAQNMLDDHEIRTLRCEVVMLRVALKEIIEAARQSLPRQHPTIERNAKLFFPENV